MIDYASIDLVQYLYIALAGLLILSLVSVIVSKFFKMPQINFWHFLIAYAVSIGISSSISVFIINNDFLRIGESYAAFVYVVFGILVFFLLFYKTLKIFVKEVRFEKIIPVFILSASFLCLIVYVLVPVIILLI